MVEIRSIKRGASKSLTEKFGCSAVFVGMALKFKSDSMLARRIRHYALNYMDYVVLEYAENN